MTDEEIRQHQFAQRICIEVSPTLAGWVRAQFERGRTVDQVRQDLNAAIRIVAAERA